MKDEKRIRMGKIYGLRPNFSYPTGSVLEHGVTSSVTTSDAFVHYLASATLEKRQKSCVAQRWCRFWRLIAARAILPSFHAVADSAVAGPKCIDGVSYSNSRLHF